MSTDSWRAKQKLFLWGNFTDEEDGFEDSSRERTRLRNIPCAQIVHSIACGWRHALFLCKTGTVFGLGSNRYGQLGLQSDALQIHVPSKLEIPSAYSLKQIACGAYHSVFVDEMNTVYSCGQGRYGAVGHGSQENSYGITQVAVGIARVACGVRHTVGINEYGRAYGWGDSTQGQLGLTQRSSGEYLRPTALGQNEVSQIAAADNITLFLRGRKVFGCGGNHLGQLGVGNKQIVWNPTPIPIFQDVVRVWAGRYSVCLTANKQTYFCGSGVFGQLLLPVKVSLQHRAVDEIFQGDSCAFAKCNDGDFLGWGSNLHGQLFEPSEVKSRLVPTEISSLRNFSKLACGKDFVVGVTVQQKHQNESVDSTFASFENDKELASLRLENSLLRKRLEQLQLQRSKANSQQRQIAELQEKYAEADTNLRKLRQENELLRGQRQKMAADYAKIHRENKCLFNALQLKRQEINAKDGLEFQQAERMLATYEAQVRASQLETFYQKGLLLKVQLECNQLLDLLCTSSFMQTFFECRQSSKLQPKKSISSMPESEMRVLFGGINSHVSKLRLLLQSIGDAIE